MLSKVDEETETPPYRTADKIEVEGIRDLKVSLFYSVFLVGIKHLQEEFHLSQCLENRGNMIQEEIHKNIQIMYLAM